MKGYIASQPLISDKHYGSAQSNVKLMIVICLGSEVCSLMLHIVVYNNRINDASGHINIMHVPTQL